jgi:hypothetical protein
VAPLPGVAFLDQYTAGYHLAVWLAPGADVTTAPAGWALTDVTADLLQPGDGSETAIAITRGRLDEFSTAAPATCVFTLINTSGNYTPRRRQGAYWPYMKVGLPVKAAIVTASATYERFSGFIDDLDPDWDETGNYAVVHVTAHGIMQRLSQGQDLLTSAQTRAVGQTSPIAWWPMEDGPAAVKAASGLPSGLPLIPVSGGSVNYANATARAAFAAGGSADGSAPLVDLSAGGTLTALVPYSSATSWRVEFDGRWDAFTGGTYTAALQFNTLSDAGLFEVDATSLGLGGLYIQYYGGGFALFTSNVAVDDGLWHHIRVDGAQSGGNIALTVTLDGVAVITQTLAGLAFGRVTNVVVNPLGFYSTVSQTAFGQMAVWAPWSSSVDTYDAFLGHAGEDPVARQTRLCADNDVAYVADGTSDAAMGPQGVDTLLNLLQQAAIADGGVLEDGVGFGVAMRTVNGRYNTPVAFTPTIGQIDPPWRPVENNLRTRNKVTATRTSGSSVTYTQPTGLPYAPGGAGGVGTYTDNVTVNADSDDTLIYQASFRVGLGTVDADRYPAMGLNLAARTALLPTWLPMATSDRMTVGAGYSTAASDPPDLILEGWSERLSRLLYKVAANTAPARPWIVGVLDTDRLDTAGLTLHALWDGAAATFTVDNSDGVLCSTAAGDYPQDLNVDGQRVTVSACAGSSNPQTMTVSVASVNGVSVSHAAGAAVSSWAPILLTM